MTRKSKWRLLLASLVALETCAGATRAQLVSPGSGKQWAGTWSDEFNNGAADLTGWSYDVGNGSGWGNNELESYTYPAGAPAPTPNPNGGFGLQTTPTVGTNNDNVFVSTDASGAGALTIRAIGTTVAGNTTYTSGRIKTGPSTSFFSQTGGLFEFRAKFPAGNGLWPAIWMMPKANTYGGWPTSGEIDIFEGKGQDTGWASSAIHSGPAWDQLNSQTRTFQQSGLRPAGWTSTDWHTYSFKWDLNGTSAGTLSFYIDGVMYHSRNGGWTVPTGQPASAPFDENFYLIMNLAVGGNFVGGLSPGAGTYDMQVDFVRAYQAITSSATPTWAADASDNWSQFTRWTASVVPNAVGAAALFGSAIQQPRTVTVDTPITLGQITFDNANRYTIGGAQTLTLATTGAAASIIVQSGDHTMSAPLLATRNTNVTVNPGSTLTISNLQTSTIGLTKAGAGTLAVKNLRLGGLLASAGTVQVMSNGTAAAASKLGTISFSGGRLDLVDNDLLITATPRGSIEAAIVAARHGGAWDGAGLTSSAALTQASTTLGVLSGDEYRFLYGQSATFDGFAVANTDVLVKYTYYGDLDFNGKVDGADYARIDATFNNETALQTNIGGWFNGDLDYNGKVDGADYALIDSAFNSQGASLRPGNVPEPGSTLLAITTAILVGGATHRMRRRHF